MAREVDQKLDDIQDKVEDVANIVHKIDKEVALQKAAFIEHTKQDEKMYDELKRMNDILVVNTESLKEHMHRSDLLEDLVQKLDKRLSPIEIEHIEEQAIKKYRKEKLIFVLKIIGAVATLVTIGMAIKPYLLKLLLL